MTVRTNADSPSQVANAVAFGATGIGLCRTEHMFFEGNRIDAMREMILAEDEPARRKALKKLLPYQRRDFQGIFKALAGKPATIRLLDPPLHEFLPHDAAPNGIWPRNLEFPWLPSRSGWKISMNSTPCLGIADAAWEFLFRSYGNASSGNP